MKKMLIVFAVAAVAVSCKSKTAESLDTQKEIVVANPAYNNSYLTDQGDMGKATSVSKDLPKDYGTTNSSTTRSNVNNNATTTRNTSTATTTTTKTTTKKKGWSNRAKGTVIGAGSGAIIGAIVSKKKGAGAIIGGLIGAGAGYVVGNEKDRKNGRNNK
jgi:hypothetical protein